MISLNFELVLTVFVAFAIAFVLFAMFSFSFRQRLQRTAALLIRGREYKDRPSYLVDNVAKSNIQIFTMRARRWKRIAEFSFVFAILSVVVGILIFVFAERIATNDPELQRVVFERNELQEKMNEFNFNVGDLSRQKHFVPAIEKSWKKAGRYVELCAEILEKENIEDYTNEDKERLLAFFQSSKADRTLIENAITELGISDKKPQGKFGEKELKHFAEKLEMGIDTAKLKRFFELLLPLFSSLGDNPRVSWVEQNFETILKVNSIGVELSDDARKIKDDMAKWKNEIEGQYGCRFKMSQQSLIFKRELQT